MRPLYGIAGWAAVATAVLIPVHVAAFIAWPPPLGRPAAEWFAVFERSEILGLVSLDLFLLIDYILLLPIVLALVALFWRRRPLLVGGGAALFVVAIAVFIASNPAFEMLDLARKHAGATVDTAPAYVAAAEAALARSMGTSFHASYILGSLAGVLVSIPMLDARDFGTAAAWTGITGNVVGLALYVPRIGLWLSVASGLILWAWYVLVARGMFRSVRHRSS